jgi:fructoselysine-6-P-deglycase FrlB-like protein
VTGDGGLRAATAPASHVAAEIASQPAAWRQAAALAGDLRASLPRGPIALTGCGTSFHVAQSVAALWEGHGLGTADAFPASEMPVRDGYRAVVLISRSNTTTELVELLRRLHDRPSLALTGNSDGPVSAAATHTLALDFADERSIVQTRFATSVLALFRALVGADVEALATAASQALAAGPPRFDGVARFVFLGTGHAVGLAHEAALKMREAALTVTESYPAMEYRHGPIALAEPGVVVWMLGTPPPGLVEDVRRTGARVVDDPVDPLVDLVRVQAAAVALAEGKGLDPDHPRHLSRAVLLPELPLPEVSLPEVSLPRESLPGELLPGEGV